MPDGTTGKGSIWNTLASGKKLYIIKARPELKSDPPIQINDQKCDLCGTCAGVCPPDCLILDAKKLIIDGSKCIKCGFCLPACPLEALKWNENDGSVENDE